jgi:hypothetical protein
MARGQAVAGRAGARRLRAFGVGVNDLAQARAVLAWQAAGRHRPVRIHGLDAPLMGAGYWSEVERILDRALVVECDDHVATALAALRCGCRRLRIADAGPQETALAGLIAAHGAVRIAEAPAVALAPGRPAAAQLARIRCERVTASPSPVKERFLGTESRSDTGHVACD